MEAGATPRMIATAGGVGVYVDAAGDVLVQGRPAEPANLPAPPDGELRVQVSAAVLRAAAAALDEEDAAASGR